MTAPQSAWRRNTKMPVATDAKASRPGPRRTVGGRVTYAGIDFHENHLLSRGWFGKQSGNRGPSEGAS